MSGRKTKGQKTPNESQIINNTIDPLVSKVIQKIEINKELTENDFYQLVLNTITNTLGSIQDTSKKQILEQLQQQIDKKEGNLLKTTFEIFSRKANNQQLDIQKLKKLPIPILNELNLNSKKLEQLPNNILQELSVEHLIKLPLEKLKQLDLTNKPTEYPIEIFKTTQELKDNIKLKGNEGYLMIGKQKVDSTTDLDREFIRADEFFSGFEHVDNDTRDKPKIEQTAGGIKYPFKPIDPQTANEIQKIMYGNIQPQNLDTLEHNLSHSEQRMMLYILQQLQKGEKIDEIVMFTGRKCCPVCHEALPKFMKYIKDNYKDLVPDKIIVYDFWNKKEYDEDRAKRGDCEKDYYAYGSKDGVNYKSVFDTSLNKTEEKHLSKFVEKINKDRVKVDDKKFNKETGQRDIPVVLIGNSQYTVESLKGDSNVPIVFSIEELEQYNSIKTPVEEIKKLVDNLKTNIEALNSSLKKLEHNGEKIDIIRQALDMEKNQLPAHDDTKSQSQFFGEQSEKNTQDKTQLETTTQIDETTQALAIKIKNLRDSLNEIKNQYIALKNNIIESEQFKEENINNIISKQQEKFEKNSIRYKQNSIALETLQDRQNGRNFVLQDYLKKTFAIDGITATVHEAQTTLNNLNNISNLQNSKGTVLASTCV